MSEPFIAEIKMFAGNFAPRGYALCNGQLLPISQHSALFSVLGATYGGDGETTFGLPDLRGRVPMHFGNGPGLTPRDLGEKIGKETNTLTVSQMPSHNHLFSGTQKASSDAGTTNDPIGAYHAKGTKVITRSNTETYHVYSNSSNTDMAADGISGTIEDTGANQPINNIQPVACVNFIIALTGIFPSED
jgi:microcystin-dependent protein